MKIKEIAHKLSGNEKYFSKTLGHNWLVGDGDDLGAVMWIDGKVKIWYRGFPEE